MKTGETLERILSGIIALIYFGAIIGFVYGMLFYSGKEHPPTVKARPQQKA